MTKLSLGARISAHPTPVWCVGTYDADGKPNVMTAAWGGVVCSKPPCVAVSLREATYSHAALMARRAYTVSIPSVTNAKEADYFGIASGRDVDKFAVTGLTPAKSEHVDAPYVAEFPLVLECKVVHIHELGLHTQFVGEIVNVLVDETMTTTDMSAAGGPKQRPDMAKLSPLLYGPDKRTYHTVGDFVGQGFTLGMDLHKQ